MTAPGRTSTGATASPKELLAPFPSKGTRPARHLLVRDASRDGTERTAAEAAGLAARGELSAPAGDLTSG
jgi:hypothetical protein